MRSRHAAFGRPISRRLVVERLEDRVSPSDLLALLAAGALVGTLDDESEAAEFGDGIAELSAAAIYSEDAVGTLQVLDLSQLSESGAEDAADSTARERLVETDEEPPFEPENLEGSSPRDALWSDLSAELGDPFFLTPNCWMR